MIQLLSQAGVGASAAVPCRDSKRVTVQFYRDDNGLGVGPSNAVQLQGSIDVAKTRWFNLTDAASSGVTLIGADGTGGVTIEVADPPPFVRLYVSDATACSIGAIVEVV